MFSLPKGILLLLQPHLSTIKTPPKKKTYPLIALIFYYNYHNYSNMRQNGQVKKTLVSNVRGHKFGSLDSHAGAILSADCYQTSSGKELSSSTTLRYGRMYSILLTALRFLTFLP